jgi:uncharacterized protein (TIGR00369 family)
MAAAAAPVNPGFVELVQRELDKSPIIALLGAHAERIDHGFVELSMMIAPQLCQVKGVLQAGIVATLCDVGAGAAIGTAIAGDSKLLSSDLSIKYLTPTSGPRIVARCRVLQNGGAIGVVQSDVFSIAPSGSERLCATALVSIVIIPKLRPRTLVS